MYGLDIPQKVSKKWS